MKFIGNVPAGRHPAAFCAIRAGAPPKVDLPALSPSRTATIIAPAEIEIE